MRIIEVIYLLTKKQVFEAVDGYAKWKRQNVTLRGIKDVTAENNDAGAAFGDGLYTAFLSNRELAKKYGDVHFVVNAKPKNPKVVNNWSEAEMVIQQLIQNYCKAHEQEYNPSFFYENTEIRTEMLNLGYDGLVIKGREMVNYTPKNVLYFRTERQLRRYYDTVVAND